MPKPTFSQRYYRNEIRPIFNNQARLHTSYGGLLALRDAWDALNVNQIQQEAGIEWGGEPPEILSFSYANGQQVWAREQRCAAGHTFQTSSGLVHLSALSVGWVV